MRTPDDVLAELRAGQERFLNGYSQRRDLHAERVATADIQAPKAVIFGCSDSRVPAELLFDQGIGDLFVVRTAGHIPAEASVHSIEFAVEQLGVPVVVVLGHTNCAAVKAGVEGTGGEHAAEWLATEVRSSLDTEPGDDQHHEARHARAVARRIAAMPGIAERIEEGTVAVRWALYDIASGRVEGL